MNALVTILITLIFVPVTRMEIRPSFAPESCAWHATDVVVVNEGDVIDGQVTVTEVWSGSLTVGTALSLPELAPFSAAKQRTVLTPYLKEKGTVVDGRTMVLFLKKEKSRFGGANQYAGIEQRLRVSTVWLHEGKLYALHQNMNPGKVTMSPAYNQTWESLHKLAVNVARNRARLEQAKKIQESKIRAEAVAEILPLLPYEGRQLCFSVIADCGKDGFDSALLIMNSKEKSTRRNVYEFLLKCDPSRAIPLLVQVIEKETTYFEEHRSRLQQGWWNGNRDTLKQVHIDRDHYSDVHRALYVLRQSKDDRLIKPVTTLKDLWVSHEPYNDPSGLNQMSKACQKILARHELR